MDSYGAAPFTPTPVLPPSPPPSLAGNDWKYEMRREAQEIIPGLWLGPFQASTNLHLMNSLRITHVLCIRDKKEAGLIFPRFPTEFRYKTLDISDNTDQNIISIFPSCRDFIEEALMGGGVVLAHCNGGIATAPAIITGYLMWKYNWTFDTALAYIQSKRYCVSPMSFTVQLKEYEPIYLAERMLEASGGSAVQRSKRSVEDENDEDEYKRKMPSRPQSLATAPEGAVSLMDMS